MTIPTLPIFTAPRANSKRWKGRELSWEKFLTFFRVDRVTFAENKKQVPEVTPAYVMGRFSEEGARSVESITSRSAITLDADHPTVDIPALVREKLAGTEALLHTTFSHTPDEPRWRIIIPLDREVTPLEYTQIAQALMEFLGAAQFDDTCDQPSRCMFRPVVRDEEALKNYQVMRFEGEPLSAEAWLITDEDRVEELEDAFEALALPHSLEGRLDTLLQAVERHGSKIEQMTDTQWLVSCPGHDDDEPSLHITINPETDKILLRDFGRGKCEVPDIMEALDLPMAILSPIDLPEVDFATPVEEWRPTTSTGQRHMAERLAQHAAGRLMWVGSERTGAWAAWDGTRWATGARAETMASRLLAEVLYLTMRDGLTDANKKRGKVLQADAKTGNSYTGQRGILGLAKTQPELWVEETDMDPYLLNCRNGTLDLRTGELRPHDPADKITAITGAAYDPTATSARWETFLAESLPDPEVRAFLQRYVGQALIGEVREHVMVIGAGKPRAGKGVFARAIKTALGEYAGTADPDLLIAGRSLEKKSAGDLSALMALRGLRWVEMSELAEGARMNEALMKSLTGNDTIRAKFMARDTEEFRPTHSFFMITNHLPRMSADDVAAWTRIRVIPFDISFEGREDRTLDEALSLERSAILAWAVEGLKQWRLRGLDEPAAVLAADQRYRAESNPLHGWLEDCCEVAENAWTPAADLYYSYEQWCQEAKATPLGRRGRKSFGEVLTSTVHEVEQKTVSNTRGYSGIRLIPDPVDLEGDFDD